jgi:broad specificity phosphatase PhoE
MNKQLINYLLDYFYFEYEVQSVTLVGSIEEKNILEVSDIDIVIIVNKLTKNLYHKIINHANEINLNKLGIDLKPKINPTFGPLKFDDKDSLVLHLMIYDTESHKQHVLSSPFTCYDWERSSNYVGLSLKEIFPVINLLPQDFKYARRGFEDYMRDLENMTISYREYSFSKDIPELVTRNFSINPQHVTEFCYHIIFNTMTNFIKLVEKSNSKYFNEEFLSKWSEISNLNFKKYNDFFQSLEYKKKHNVGSKKSDILETRNFLEDFYHRVLSGHFSNQGLFIRHCETEFNDGRFFGRKLDTNIDSVDLKKIAQVKYKKENINKYITSPLKRCVDSMEKLNLINFETSNNLLEMDYGEAEGLFFEEFKIKYPKIVNQWKDGKDEPFPSGENYAMVYERLSNYLNFLKNHNCFLMTHQGVVRSFIGYNLNIDISKWYLLNIPHLEPIGYINLNEEFYLDINRKLLYKIFKDYIKELHCNT